MSIRTKEIAEGVRGRRRSPDTLSTPAGAASPNAVFGERVRRLRQDRRLTLQQLAKACDVATSTISKVENGQMSPTYENIIRLANGLGVDVADLFSDRGAATSGRRSITRAAGGTRLSTPHYDYEMLCTDLTNRHFIPIHATVRARDIKEFPRLTSHDGEEFIYVLSGSIALHTEYYEPVELGPGDSCYFASGMGHALVNATAQDAKVLWVCSHIDIAGMRKTAAEGDAQPAGQVTVAQEARR